jgi:hypothetical protein
MIRFFYFLFCYASYIVTIRLLTISIYFFFVSLIIYTRILVSFLNMLLYLIQYFTMSDVIFFDVIFFLIILIPKLFYMSILLKQYFF